MTGHELNTRALTIAADLKTNYLELFEILLEMRRRDSFLGFGVTSLKAYCTEVLQLSNSIAKDFQIVVEKSVLVPELAEAIRAKRTTIAKARKICGVLKRDNANDWIDLASECSARIIEQCVARAKPREAVFESMTPVADDVLEFKIAVSEKWELLLIRTKDLMSQQQNRAVTSEEALEQLMERFCEANDPVLKAVRASARSSNSSRTCRSARSTIGSRVSSGARVSNIDRSSAESRSRYRSAHIEHAVNLRDQGRCTYIKQDGSRCESRRWLHKHHLVEFAQGGDHSVDNLVTLCSAHHRMHHEASSG